MRRPIAHSTVVVLPAPFGPRMPKISPSATENENVVDRDQRSAGPVPGHDGAARVGQRGPG